MEIESLPTQQRKRQWHPLRDGKVGAIVGLPTFSGKLIATDGILCQILTPHGRVVEGHLEFFEESRFAPSKASNTSTKTTTRRKAPKALSAYC